MKDVKLVFIKSIQRKETRGRDRAWGFFHDDRSCPHKMFVVAEYDRGIIDQLKEAGLDLDRMIHHEVITCKILVRYELKPLRAGSLDAKRPTIVNIEKLVERQQSAYDRIGELMKQYGYSSKDALRSTPHYIVGECMPSGSLPVIGRDRDKLIRLAEEWLEKWQAKRAITAASAPSPVIEIVLPVVQTDVPPTVPLFEQSPKVAYFTRLLAEMPAPVTASAPLLLPARVPDRPAPRQPKTIFIGVRRIIKSGPTIHLPPSNPVALLPAVCASSADMIWRIGAPDLGEPITVECTPLPSPRISMVGRFDDEVRFVFFDGIGVPNIRVEPVGIKDMKRGSGREHVSPFASRSQFSSVDQMREDLDREIFEAAMKGARRE